MTLPVAFLLMFSVQAQMSISSTTNEAAKMDMAFESRLLNAIKREEGSKYPYGITYKDAQDVRHGYPEPQGREIAQRTVEHSWARYEAAGATGDFISWLGRTYARDPLWASKVRKLLAQNNRK